MSLKFRLAGLALVLAAAAPASTVHAAPSEQTLVRLSFFSAHPQKMVDFYTKGLGFTKMWDAKIGEGANARIIANAWHLPKGATISGTMMRAPRGNMEIQVTYMVGARMVVAPRSRDAAPVSGQAYMVFHVPNLDATLAALKPFNVQFNRKPMKMTALDKEGRSFPVYEAVVYDPEGTPIILVQDPDSLNPYAKQN